MQASLREAPPKKRVTAVKTMAKPKCNAAGEVSAEVVSDDIAPKAKKMPPAKKAKPTKKAMPKPSYGIY